MKLAIAAALALTPAAVVAQDMQPVFDLPTMAQGQVISATAKGYSDRARARRHYQQRRTTSRADCSDMGDLRARVGSLSRDDYMRYRACQGLSD